MRCVAVSMAILLSAAAATSHLSSEHSATDASTQQRPRRIGNWPSDLALDIPPSITHCHHGDVARPDKRTSTSTQSGSQSHRPRRYIPDTVCNAICSSLCYTMKTDAVQNLSFLADRTNGRAYASVSSVRLSSVTYVHVLWLNGASYGKTV